MSDPTPEDIKEIISVNNFLCYVKSNPNPQDFEIFQAIMKMQSIGKKMIEKKWPENSVDEHMDLHDMKEVIEMFFEKVCIAKGVPNVRGE